MEKISRKNWALVWLLGMAGQICWNVENSWFNTFVYNKIAPDPSIVAWMVAVSAVITTVCTILIGTWSDRIGRRKPFICFGYILWGIFTIVFGMAEFLPKNPLWLVASFVVLADAIMSFFGSVGNDCGFNAWTTDISNPGNRGKLTGALAVMPVLATILGTVVSGMLIESLDFFAFFIIMGVMVMAFGLFGLLLLKDAPSLSPVRDEKGFLHQLAGVFNYKTVRDNKELFWVFLVMVVYFIGFNVYFPYITIYFVNYLGYGYDIAGYLQGGSLVAAAVLTIPAAKLIDKGKLALSIYLALIANAIGLVMIALSTGMVTLIIGMFGAGCGYILTLQTLLAWMKNLYPEEQRGQFEGIKQFFFVALPMVFGPMLATPVIRTYGLEMLVEGELGMVPTPVLFLVSAVVTSLAGLPLIMAGRLNQKRRQMQQDGM